MAQKNITNGMSMQTVRTNINDNFTELYDAVGAIPTVNDTLTSSSTTSALSANQGRVLNTALSNKVDKVAGKGLSTEDYTTVEKSKLATIADGANNYIHPATHSITEVDGLQSALDNKVDSSRVLTDVPANAKFTDTVYTHPVSHPPSIIAQDANNRFVSDTEKSYWNDKANGTHQHSKTDISDFPTLATVATSGNYSDLSGKPSIPTVNDTLTSSSTTEALSAKQGKALKDELNTHKADNIHKAKNGSLYANALTDSLVIPEGSLQTSFKSINENKTLKIVAWGDSITEQADLINGNVDGYISRFTKDLEVALTPFGITSTVLNYSMGGRNSGHAISDTFVGGASDTDTTFYRLWSVVGKTWKDHVKDATPDLVIIAFGMNDAGGNGSDKTFYDNLSAIVTYIKTWAKVPDIVIVPTILPTTNTGYYSQRNDSTNAVARAAREYAKSQGFIVADANRLFRILRDGIDEGKKYSQTEFNFEGFPNGWAGEASSFTLSGNILTPTTGLTSAFAVRSRDFLDGIISVEVNPVENTDSGLFRIYYRTKDIGTFILQVRPDSASNGYVQLYKDTTLLGAATGLTIPAGSYTKFEIVTYGTSHKIYVAGVLRIDITTYFCLHEGTFGLGAPGDCFVPTFQNAKITYFDAITASPMYTELELLGAYNDPLHDGNAINHPTGLGHAIVYRNAMSGLLNKLVSQTDYKITFSVHKNGVNQVISNGVDTKVTFDTEVFDIGGCFANSKFTPTKAGIYRLHAVLNYTDQVDGQSISAAIWKNGAMYKIGKIDTAGGTGSNSCEVSCLVVADGVSDYFEAYTYQGAGSDRTIDGTVWRTYFEGEYIK